MSITSIDDSAVEELVYLGAPTSRTLKQHVSDRVDDIESMTLKGIGNGEICWANR